MQITAQYTSELMTAVGLFFGAILLVRFTWNRVKNLPEGERQLGRPLWIAALSLFFLGVSSVVNYGYGGLGMAELEIFWYISALLGSGLLMISALMILGSRKLLFIPIIMVASIGTYAFLETTFGGFMGDLSPDFVINLLGLVIFAIPFGLFTYLTFTTKRITSLALAMLSFTYPLILAATSFTDPSIVTAILGLRLYGSAILITALVLPESKIGAELIAYSFTVSSLLYFMTYLLVSPVVVDISAMTSVTFIALGSILSIGTAAYALTRWKSSRNPATLTLGVFFFVSGFSWLIVALNHVEFLGGLNAEYIALLLGLLAPMLLNLSSIVALDWKRALLLPILIMAAPLFMMLSGWTAQILPDAIPNRGIVMAISGILQTIVPLGLYGLLWWRMRKAGAPGRSRALFLAIGVVFLILGTAGGNAVSTISSTCILSAFGVWWLGITGRADQFFGTLV